MRTLNPGLKCLSVIVEVACKDLARGLGRQQGVIIHTCRLNDDTSSVLRSALDRWCFIMDVMSNSCTQNNLLSSSRILEE